MKRPKVVVTGRTGQIGYELERVMTLIGDVIPTDVNDLDLSDKDQIVNFMRLHKPDIVVNAAAYTSVDTAEEKQELAMKVNADAPGVISEELKKYDGLMVHFSTDFAYDGARRVPYIETNSVNPLSTYAKGKVQGDNNIMDSGVRHLIFRTGWLYGARSKNFLTTVINMCSSRDEFSVVNDQYGAPTWCRVFSEAVGMVLNQSKAYDKSYSGIYHMTNDGKVTWYDFASEIVKHYEERYKKKLRIYPASTGQYPMKAKRPEYSVLDNSKLYEAFDVRLPNWIVSLKQVMQDMGMEMTDKYSIYRNFHNYKKSGKVEE